MAKYTINTHHNGREWIATFDDYDGAPDSPNRSVMGKADNEVDAIMDLLTEDWAGMPKIPILGHEWKAHRQPSTPDSPEEWFYSCANCGVEKDDDNEYEPCVPTKIPIKVVPLAELLEPFDADDQRVRAVGGTDWKCVHCGRLSTTGFNFGSDCTPTTIHDFQRF